MSSLSHEERESNIRELRRLLFESELQSLHGLQRVVSDPKERKIRFEQDLCRLLDSLSPSETRELARDIRPVTRQALAMMAQDAPDELGRILTPALGPFIRSYVRLLVSGTVDGCAKLLDSAFTLRSLRWRWEAWTTGRAFGEIALYHSLLYRVRRVLLIHEPTGALLCAASTEESEVDDDLVSGMLSAFRSFMRSSMEENDASTANLIQSGAHSFLVQQSGDLLLGAQIDGMVRPRLSEQLVETLESVERRFRDEVARFKGDTTPFEAARPRLEECLVFEAELPGGSKWTRRLAIGLLAAFLVLLATAFGLLVFRDLVFGRYVEALRDQPGIVVTSHATGWLQPELVGMRDPLAPEPAALWRDTGAADQWFGPQPKEHWTSVLLAEPSLVERRLERAFEASKQLEVSVEDQTGTLAGEVADRDDIRRRWLHPAWLGLDALDDSELDTRDRAIEALRAEVDALRLPFPLGKSAPVDEATLAEAVRIFRRLDRAIEGPVRIEVVGRADPSGPEALNQRLRLERALAVREALAALTWERLAFVAVFESAGETEHAEPSVSFRVPAW
jgi:outer membrane protein OmpA-like peptidoglycan-associated protein